MGIWDSFESMATVDEVNEAREKTFTKPTAGMHTVELVSVEPSETSTGQPTVKFRFKDCDNNNMIVHSMFLTNMNHPDYTPQNIARAINFAEAVSGKDIKFSSMSQLAQDFSELSFGGKIEIEISYRTPESKYPEVTVIRRIDTTVDEVEI